MLIQIRADIWVNPDHIVGIEREESSNSGASVFMLDRLEICTCLTHDRLLEHLRQHGVEIVKLPQ